MGGMRGAGRSSGEHVESGGSKGILLLFALLAGLFLYFVFFG